MARRRHISDIPFPVSDVNESNRIQMKFANAARHSSRLTWPPAIDTGSARPLPASCFPKNSSGDQAGASKAARSGPFVSSRGWPLFLIFCVAKVRWTNRRYVTFNSRRLAHSMWVKRKESNMLPCNETHHTLRWNLFLSNL